MSEGREAEGSENTPLFTCQDFASRVREWQNSVYEQMILHYER